MSGFRKGWTVVRTQMRVLTAVFPHNGNKRFLIPNRGKDLTTGESVPGASIPQP